MWKHFIGNKSKPIKNLIEAGAIKKFAEAIGDLNPVYIDEKAAKNTIHGGIIAPPTFPRTFDYGEIPGVDFPREGLIHGEQLYHYNRPIYLGEVLYCQTELVDVQEKEGKTGKMTFVTMKQYGKTDTGEEVFWSKRVTIIMPTVREMFFSET